MITLDTGQVLLLITGAFGAMASALAVLWKALARQNEEQGERARAEFEELRRERDEYKRELFELLGLADRATRALDSATRRTAALPRELNERLSRIEAQREPRQPE